MSGSLKVQARLKGPSAVWFQQRLTDSKLKPSELIEQIVKDRISLEENPFKWIADQKAKGPLKKSPQGYFSLIPDFSGQEAKGGQT